MRSKSILIWLLVAVTLVGCRPRDVLSSREMRDVLYDLHRADAILQVAGYNYGHDEAVAKYYQVVLDKHGVTQAQFDSSMVWYTDHPQRFDKIYPKVIALLEKDQELLNAQLEEESRQWREHVVVVRELPELEQIEREYRHGWPNLWLKMQENEEKCKKVDEKFVYVEIIL